MNSEAPSRLHVNYTRRPALCSGLLMIIFAIRRLQSICKAMLVNRRHPDNCCLALQES